MKNYSFFSVLALLHFICLHGLAQNEYPTFKRINTNDGLSQGHVSAILKDRKGFMWFATDEGINKYDGYRFTVYKHDPEKASSISNNAVFDVLEDKAGNLWIGTASGLDKFDRNADSFIHYPSGRRGGMYVKDIFQDSKSRIWLGTTEGLYLFDAAKGSFFCYRHAAAANSLSDDIIYRVTEDNDGRLWIATKNGLNVLYPETGHFLNYKNEPGNNRSIGANWIKSVYKDSKGNIWAGTQGSGIALFSFKDNSFTNFRHNDADPGSISHNDILSFAEDNKGKLWVGTENGGISVLDDLTNSFTHYQFDINNNNSLSNNSIYCIYKDDINNIWVGTFSDGINFLPFYGDKFRHYNQIPGDKNSLSNSIILSITADSNGAIWIGTDGGGLNLFDKKSGTFSHYRYDKNKKNGISSDYVLSVIEVEPGILGIGYHRGGFDLFDIKKGVFTHHLPDENNSNSLSTLTVNVIFQDRSGLLWLGTWGGGLDVYDRKTNSYTHYKNNPADSTSINNNFIHAIVEDNTGNMWVATGGGLNLFNRKNNGFIHFVNDPHNEQSINNNSIESIFTDKAGNTWLATGGGLSLFNRKTNSFKLYTEKDGLSSNMIRGILEDNNGNFWVSSNRGLSKFNPVTKICRNYDASDGLQGSEFKSRAVYKAPDGQMFFGGPAGLNIFYPDSIKDNDYIPPVYFTEFQIFNKPVAIGNKTGDLPAQHISSTGEITLSYKHSVFTFEFSALNFTLPAKNQYAYKLENFDKDWNYVGNKRTATYTNLDAGEYIFHVMASNNDNIWNRTGTSIKIIITPPFWLTGWFKLLAFVSIIGCAFTFYTFRINAINNQKLKLQQQVLEQTHQLVQSTLEEQKARREAEQANTELAQKNKEVEQFIYIASHDLQEPLRTTTGFVELLQQQYKGKLDEKADKYFNFITDASTRMKTLITDLLDYSKIGTKKEFVTVDCNLIMQEVMADLGDAISKAHAIITAHQLPVITGYPTEIKQLFQNLVINAIKFRKKDITPQITIAVEDTGDYWEFTVKDNGIGIEGKFKEKIFLIFQRLHTRTEYEGSGIGLAHSKKIVEIHGGKIWIESEPGEGTTFHFTIQKER